MAEGKKKITVIDITWFYAAPTPSGFASNGVVLGPDDKREVFRHGYDVTGEMFTFAKNHDTLYVPKAWLWREERTREIEVKE